METRTAAPFKIHGSSDSAKKMSPPALMRSSTARLAPPRIEFVAKQSGPLRPPRLYLGAGSLEEVANQVGERRHAPASEVREQILDVLVPKLRASPLPAKERRVAQDHVCLGPLGLADSAVSRRGA